MAARPRYLQPDERILLDARRHPLSILDALLGWGLLWLAVLAATAYVLAVFYPEGWLSIGVPVALTATVGYASIVVAKVLRVRTSRYTITTERVYKEFGRWRFYLGITTFDKLTDLHVHQSFFGRLRGFGTVRVETAGAGLALEGLRDPFGARRVIERARASFLRTVATEHAGTARKAKAAATPAAKAAAAEAAFEATVDEAQPLWEDGPSASFFVGHAVGASFLLLGAITFFVTSPLEVGLLFPAFGMLAFALLTGLGAWAQYRYTRYRLLPDGVVVTSGWLTRRRVETTFDKVTDVAMFQGIVGRLLDYGQITVNTAGGTAAPVVFRGLADPERIKEQVDEARRAWRRRRA